MITYVASVSVRYQCGIMTTMDERPGNGNDLLNFVAATVESLRDQFGSLHDNVADLHTNVAEVREQMVTKSDLAQVATRLSEKIEVETTTVRGDIEQVQIRLDNIERALSARLGQLEAEMSRLRSVVYLLA